MFADRSSAKSILIVEDDDVIRDVMLLLLKTEGYKVFAAANGREALDLLHRDGRPDLILLDLMMPEMDGWQFRRAQRQDPELSRIPVVVVSATEPMQEEADALDARGFLKKPVEVEALCSAVHQYC
jgi:CheY-like chemotaxis protein